MHLFEEVGRYNTLRIERSVKTTNDLRMKSCRQRTTLVLPCWTAKRPSPAPKRIRSSVCVDVVEVYQIYDNEIS